MVRPEVSLLTVKRAVTAVVVLAVLAVLVPLAAGWIADARSRCADGVVRKGAPAQCVGVTDGSYAFAPHLRDVTGRIAEENRKVVEEGGKEPYVSVAYLTSFTLDEDDSNSEESVRHQLQGAYLAQQRLNRRDQQVNPRIRLLIANLGSEAEHWEHTVGELIGRQGTDDRLVAVTGLGPSTERSRAALKRLSAHGLATVASTMTATNIGAVRGFVRVAPTNLDEARAAAAYLRGEKIRTAVVVQDVAKRNLYANTLGDAFTEEFPRGKGDHELVSERKTFDSSVPGAWKNELHYVAEQLCVHQPEVVYFAGRGQHLTHFLDALANRSCDTWEFMVMTGDDTTNLTARQISRAADSGVRVLYTGLAHPDMWGDGKGGDDVSGEVSPRSVRYFRDGQLMDSWFPNDPRGDGQAIMAHDAVLTAGRGIGMAARLGSSVTGEEVGRMFHQMNGNQRVAGASGFLSFANDGYPRGKAVPVLELKPDGTPVFRTVLSPAR